MKPTRKNKTSLLLIKFTHKSPTIDEFRDKDLGDSS